MIAYRLGELSDVERTKEQECLPSGPRINLSDAQQLRLPDGTLFCEASEEHVMRWFLFLFDRAGVSRQLCNEILNGVDLSEFDYRWWVLNEILEQGSVRDVLEGKKREPVILHRLPDAISRDRLARVVREYGLRITRSRKPDGSVQVYAQQNNAVQKLKIYLCGLAALENGQVTEQMVRRRMEKRGLCVLGKERKVA